MISGNKMQAMLLEMDRGITIENSKLSLNEEEREFWHRAEADMRADRAAGYTTRFPAETLGLDVDPKRPQRYDQLAEE